MDQSLDVIGVLKTIPLFLEFTPSQLDQIGRISDLVEIDPGDIPIKEGSLPDFVYIILEGEISVAFLIPTQGQVETSKLGTYDIIGWSSLTPIIRQSTATITALTHCWLLRMDGRLLTKLCEEDHTIGFIIYRRISNVAARSFLTTRLQLMNLLSRSSN